MPAICVHQASQPNIAGPARPPQHAQWPQGAQAHRHRCGHFVVVLAQRRTSSLIMVIVDGRSEVEKEESRSVGVGDENETW